MFVVPEFGPWPSEWQYASAAVHNRMLNLQDKTYKNITYSSKVSAEPWQYRHIALMRLLSRLLRDSKLTITETNVITTNGIRQQLSALVFPSVWLKKSFEKESSCLKSPSIGRLWEALMRSYSELFSVLYISLEVMAKMSFLRFAQSEYLVNNRSTKSKTIPIRSDHTVDIKEQITLRPTWVCSDFQTFWKLPHLCIKLSNIPLVGQLLKLLAYIS